jgi:hypothetical protein
VVRVHRQIARALEIKIARRVPGKERQHVIEERHARPDPGPARTVDPQAQIDPGFGGDAADARRSVVHLPSD